MDLHILENLVVYLKELQKEYSIVFGNNLKEVIQIIEKIIKEQLREPKGSKIFDQILNYVENLKTETKKVK